MSVVSCIFFSGDKQDMKMVERYTLSYGFD